MVQDPSNVKDPVDINDIEDFINGLKTTFDSLDGQKDPGVRGYQSKLAKAISALRLKKMAKVEPEFNRIQNYSKEELKTYLLKKLNELRTILDNNEYQSPRRKFNLVMKITKLREKINHFL